LSYSRNKMCMAGTSPAMIRINLSALSSNYCHAE
jgi:hypothetical protein